MPLSLLLNLHPLPPLHHHHHHTHMHTHQFTASLLYGVLSARIMPTFHKLNVHAAMTPADILNHLKPVFKQAKMLSKAFQSKVSNAFTPSVPFVTVSAQYSFSLFSISVNNNFDTENRCNFLQPHITTAR